MSMVSFGDLAQSFVLKTAISRLNKQSSNIGKELSTGIVSDIGGAVQGDHTALSALRRSRALNTSYINVSKEAITSLKVTQSALSNLRNLGQSVANDITTALTAGDQASLSLASERGKSSLEQAISSLNVRAGNRAPFAGKESQSLPVESAAVILTALSQTLTGVTTANAAIAAIQGWFTAPAGYETVAYHGGSAREKLQISETQSVPVYFSANDPAIKRALMGFAATALINDPALNLNAAEKKSFIAQSANAIRTGSDQVVELSARVGLSQERIENVLTRSQAENLTLETAESDLVATDQFKLATELEATSTNLEMLFQVTARLSRLKLSDYIR